MRLETISSSDAADNTVDESDENYCQKIVCPVCGEIWLVLSCETAEFHSETACPHFKFGIEPEASEITYIDKSLEAKLLKAVELAYVKIQPDTSPMAGEEILRCNMVNEELWKNVELSEVDTLLEHTEYGIACGPVSTTIYFGAKLNTMS
jgi:hypothetical protein